MSFLLWHCRGVHLVRDAPLRHHRALTVVTSAAGVLFYLSWRSGGLSAWGPMDPIVGTALLCLTYYMAAQTPTGLYIWRIFDVLRRNQSLLRSLNPRLR